MLQDGYFANDIADSDQLSLLFSAVHQLLLHILIRAVADAHNYANGITQDRARQVLHTLQITLSG